MNADDLRLRFFNFAVDVATFLSLLPDNLINRTYSQQLIRCSSSCGAAYHAAARGKSRRDFVYKLKLSMEELDESIYFLNLLQHFNTETARVRSLCKEG